MQSPRMQPSSDPGPAGSPGPIYVLRKRWQALFRALRERGAATASRLPPGVRRILGKPVNFADMLFIDHGLFRLVYLNRHRLGAQAWRAAQPAPHNIRHFAEGGIRTIINLRGPRDCGSYRLEREACAETEIALVDFPIGSRQAPEQATIRAAVLLFDRVAYPMLMHCKSGADRAGLMSVLYLHLREGVPVDDALSQLSLRFGHVRSADTGILDAFFESYIRFNRTTPVPFLEWVERYYDPIELKRAFVAGGWSSWVLGRVLGRE